MVRSIVALACLLMVLLSGVPTAWGIEWRAGVGNFLEDGNWSAGHVPTRPDGCVVTNGGTAQLSSGLADVSEFTLGYANGMGRFEQSGGLFQTSTVIIGQQGAGTAQITGGHFAIGDTGIQVGLRAGSNGALHVDDADALASTTGRMFVGNEGVGAVSLTAGQLRAGNVIVGNFGQGTWTQTGGVFDQLFGDFIIGHGGGDGDAGVVGVRHGDLQLSAGTLHPAENLVLGAGYGDGHMSIRGGSLAITGSPTSSLIIGQGNSPASKVAGDAELRVRGKGGVIIANGDFAMNPNGVMESASLVAEITGPQHTPIRVGGDARISRGILKVDTDQYTPSLGDSWLLIETGADLSGAIAAVDAEIASAGYDALQHAMRQRVGTVQGQFLSVDTSEAPLPAGLRWDVAYSSHAVTLSVLAVPEPTVGLWVLIALLNWKRRRRD